MKDNRGFTLIEVLATIIVISIIGIFVAKFIGSTLTLSQNEAYEIMKKNIISSSSNYIKECDSQILNCGLTWNDNETSFYATELENSGYFKNLKSPLDGKYLGTCLQIIATKENGTVEVDLIDYCY